MITLQPAGPERARDLAHRHAEVARRVADLAPTGEHRRAAGRGVELITVTKFFPASDVVALYDAGVRAVGENRDQEAAPKAQALEEYRAERAAEGQDAEPLSWHYIGQLQTNKAKSVARYATSVHSVDRVSLVTALGKGYRTALERWENEDGPRPAAHPGGGLECLIQVGLGDDEATPGEAARGRRGGADPAEIPELAEAIASAEGLRLGGLMAVAPLGDDPAGAFERLWELSQRLQEDFPAAGEISAGMSADLGEAIRWGSTRVRVGRAVMGPRPER